MQISTEDFRVMTESFGMQLDDDSLLAVFQKVNHLVPIDAAHLPFSSAGTAPWDWRVCSTFQVAFCLAVKQALHSGCGSTIAHCPPPPRAQHGFSVGC